MTAIKQHLTQLETTGLLRLAQTHPELVYLFRHALVQDAAYESLLLADRKQLHRQVAETLERLYPDRLDELSGQLAKHFAVAEESEKAIKYARRAARWAEAMYAYDEAVQHLQTALDLIEPHEQSVAHLTLLEELADVQNLLGQYSQAISLYQSAFEQWSALADADKMIAVRLHRKILQTAWGMWRSVEVYEQFEATAEIRATSQEYLEFSLISTGAEPPQLERVRVLTALASIGLGIRLPSDLDTAEGYAQAAVELAEQLDTPEELSDALKALADIYFEGGQLSAYLTVLRRRLTLSRDPRFGDVRKRIDILCNLALGLHSTLKTA